MVVSRVALLALPCLALACGGPDTSSLALEPDTVKAELDTMLAAEGLEPLPQAPEVSEELYRLGQSLAFDKLLSGNEDISCMTCHHPTMGSGDERALSLGVGGAGLGGERSEGELIARHAQPLFNLDLFDNMFWDGRVELDEQGALRTPAGDALTPQMQAVFEFGVVSAQAMFPVTDAHEMRGAPGSNELADLADDDFTGIWAALMARLGAVPAYVEMFEAAYPGESFEDMSFAHAANAIAGFEIAAFDLRDSPWQAYIGGDADALDEEALRGAHLFYTLGCQGCHSGAVMSDFDFHNLALAQFGPGKGHGPDGNEDYGREGVTGELEHRYQFRTAPLFNIDLTAPYGHLGQHARLRNHMRVYANPRQFWLNTYEIEAQVEDPSLWSTLVDNADAILDALDEDDRVDDAFGNDELGAQNRVLEAFMTAQTDARALDLEHLTPTSVASGLPVED